MAMSFTIEAHPTNAALVLYRAKNNGVDVWVNELPANDWQAQINRSFPVTDTRDSQVKNWAPNAAQIADANREAMIAKIQAAIAANIAALALPNPTAANTTYIGSAALPAGAALTTTQLTTIVRALDAQLRAVSNQNNALVAQVRALTQQNTALERHIGNQLDTTSGT